MGWLIEGGVGPATVAVPVNVAGNAAVGAAARWWRRLRRTDDLSRLIEAATGVSIDLTHDEFNAVRELLEDQQTWSLLGDGTVEELAGWIGSRLQPVEGPTSETSLVAGTAIARGLLEFSVADVDPKLFQQLLLARLRRLESGQASALDTHLLNLHADLVVGLAEVTQQLKRVLERLPPGPATRSEIVVYLKTLIDWVNIDPWPREQWWGHAITVSSIERKLRVSVTDSDGRRDFDADELARQFQRLIILGGPGSGKTWLAKRTARRCADDALHALAAGIPIDQIELPLYTTCSRLFAATGDIREAVVSSALDYLGDLGGSRVTAKLREFFTVRNEPVVLLIDSLDEASGHSERLRQADTLPWRIVLTSRPTAWNDQLVAKEGNDAYKVSELLPLRYPDDVESFIFHWFDKEPERARDLAAQIANRHGLQQAATVPLILAFYCIIGSKTLPVFRYELYDKVLNRMLTGGWRGGDGTRTSNVACVQALQAWAWSGADSHPISGVGTWIDDISTKAVQLSQAEQSSLDHIAAPLGRPDVDTGRSTRRFIHRSMREHLIARYIASLPAEEAARNLLPHLWYDQDWEYVAPAALAMHPRRSWILKELLLRTVGTAEIPEDLSIVDADWEFRQFLSRVANESNQADWETWAAEIIGQARLDLARSGRLDTLGGEASWVSSNRQIRSVLLNFLRRKINVALNEELTNAAMRLCTTREEDRQISDDLLAIILRESSGFRLGERISEVARLAPTGDDRRGTREKLLTLLTRTDDSWHAGSLADAIAQLNPTGDDQRRAREKLLTLLIRTHDSWHAGSLADAIAQLNPTGDDQRRAREKLLTLLTSGAGGAAHEHLVDLLIKLKATVDDKRRARDLLLPSLAKASAGQAVERLAYAVSKLDPTPQDKQYAVRALLGLLAGSAGEVEVSFGFGMAIFPFDKVAEDKGYVIDALLYLLGVEPDRRPGSPLSYSVAPPDTMTDDDQRQARERLLGILAEEVSGWTAARLSIGLAKLRPALQEKHDAVEILVRLIARQPYTDAISELVKAIVRLDPVEEHKRHARQILIELLECQEDGIPAQALADELTMLNPTQEDARRGREILLGLLTNGNAHWAGPLMGTVNRLGPTEADKREACKTLLELITGLDRFYDIMELAGAAVQWLDLTEENKRSIRETVLTRMSDSNIFSIIRHPAYKLTQLDLTTEEKRSVRESLLTLISHGPGVSAHRNSSDIDVLREVALLDPTVHDLSTWRSWTIRPSSEFITAVRLNSTLEDWLAALPSLSELTSNPL